MPSNKRLKPPHEAGAATPHPINIWQGRKTGAMVAKEAGLANGPYVGSF
jgi:hypothetical protein